MTMLQARRRSVWRGAALAAAIALLGHPAAGATASPASVKNADQDIAKGNLRAAEIELRNAARESPQDPLIRARLAKVFLELGDPISAEREARAARERHGNEADYLPVLADALLSQGKFADVLDLIQPGNRAPALESQLRLALGIAASATQDNKKAETMLRDAVRLDPGAAPPKIALARLLMSTKPDEAGKLIDAAIAADPRSVEARQVKGEMLRGHGDLAGAMSQFDAALKIDPHSVPVRLSRAGLNLAEGKYKAADEDLDPVLKATPNNFMANYLRGLELAKQRQYTAADRIFDHISSVYPRFPSGYYLQGATKLALGQYAQAESILGKYLARFPNDVRAARLAASAALKQRAPDRAIQYLKPVADKAPLDAEAITVLGNAYMANGKPELALQQFEKAAALEPKNPAIETRVAISEISAGQGKQGLAELERVFDTDTGAPIAGPTLILTELRAGQTDKASVTAAALVKRDANNSLYQTLLGMVRVAERNYPPAEAAFRAALAHQPDFAPAMRDLAQLYLATGRADDAGKVYHDFLAKKPDDTDALLGLANIAATEKKWPEATDYVNRARSAAPSNPAPGLALVRLYEMRQDWANAKAVASALGAQFPSDITVLETQGRAQFEAGDTNGAVSSYKRAYELAPNSPQILTRYLALLNAANYSREALAVLRGAVTRDPKNTSLKVDLIREIAKVDGLDAAISQANSDAKNDPSSNVYDQMAAALYEAAGRTADALALLEKASAARPTDDGLVTSLVQLYIRTGHFDKAETVLKSRIQADPKNVAARLILAPFYLATGRPAEAEKVYNDLLAQQPKNVAGLLGLADVAIAEKKWPAVTDDIARARAAAPTNPAPGIKLVNYYGMRQDWKNATATADALALQFPANLDVLDAQARARIGAGDMKGGVAAYKQAYTLAPTSAPIFSRYLAALNAAKDYSGAQNVLQAALDRDPKNAAVKADLIRVAAEIGGLDAGLAKARSFAKDDPNDSLYDLVSADLLQKAGRGAEAVAQLEKDVTLRPKDDDLRIGLARLYSATGNEAKAEGLLNERLKADPTNYAIQSALGSLYLNSKNYDAAIAEYNRLVAAKPTDPTTLNNLAWLYQQKGDLPKARDLAERAVIAAPNAAQIDDTLGWILLAQGDAGKAVTYLTAANNGAPADPAIQYHLAVALHRVGRSADAQATLEKLLGSGASFTDKAEAEKLLQQLKRG